jgi:hypothetical protein
VRKIIGVCGLIGSGKGTISSQLVREYGFVELSFADLLKDVAATAFGWQRNMLQGDTKESREWREVPDKFWSNELDKPVSPRLALQLLGTECFRNGFHENFWVLSVKKIIQDNPEINYVIPDARFKNEKMLITSLGGEVWRVQRGPNPIWYSRAISYNTSGMPTMDCQGVHPSEWSWIDLDSTFAHVIINDSSLEDLNTSVNNIMKKIK